MQEWSNIVKDDIWCLRLTARSLPFGCVIGWLVGCCLPYIRLPKMPVFCSKLAQRLDVLGPLFTGKEACSSEMVCCSTELICPVMDYVCLI
jgi:hypothetical protein